MGLTALLVLQHARAAARLDADHNIVLLEDQDRRRWDRTLIAEGLILIEKAFRHHRAGPFQVQAAIAAEHDRAAHAEETDWKQIDHLYALLETLQPSPVVTLNRAVAVAKVHGRWPLTLIEAAGRPARATSIFTGEGCVACATRPRG
jgi:RNA polymerase sigma-70 factor (ECF subfamily)